MSFWIPLFKGAFTAIDAMKKAAGGKKVVAEMGNWGCGAFGNNVKTVALLQGLAADCHGIEVQYHPISPGEAQAWKDGLALKDKIKADHPNATVDELLDIIAAHADEYGLVYGVGNRT